MSIGSGEKIKKNFHSRDEPADAEGSQRCTLWAIADDDTSVSLRPVSNPQLNISVGNTKAGIFLCWFSTMASTQSAGNQ